MKKVLILVILFFTLSANDAKNNIKKVVYDVNNLSINVKYENDLKIEKDNILFNIFITLSHLESNNGEFLYNKDEEAVGVIQIRPIMVKEVNQMLGVKRYTLEDRWCEQKSFEMFKIYQDYVNPEYDEELACRFWNGGRSGDKKKTTDVYVDKYFKIKEKLKDII